MKHFASILVSAMLSVLTFNAQAEEKSLYYKIPAGGGKEIEVNDYISAYCAGMIAARMLMSNEMTQDNFETFHIRVYSIISNRYAADTVVDYDEYTRDFNDGVKDIESCVKGETTTLTPQMQTKLTCRQTLSVCDTEVGKLLGK